jgi:hypothetical protein
MSFRYKDHLDSFFYNGKEYEIINNISPMDYYFEMKLCSIPLNYNGQHNSYNWGMGSVIFSFIRCTDGT